MDDRTAMHPNGSGVVRNDRAPLQHAIPAAYRSSLTDAFIIRQAASALANVAAGVVESASANDCRL